MFTNTFSPHVGGVARSVSGLAQGLRDRGHRVLVVAPEFPAMPDREEHVIRIPALQQFAGTDFSVPIPASRSLDEDLEAFAPDIVHSHHPFLLGGTALRVAAFRNLPVIFTYHTRYELYGHYALQNSPVMMRLALNLALGYCSLCDAIIAPSESTAEFLDQHDISVPLTIIPTGVKKSEFATGDANRVLQEMNIPPGAFVVGHVGRLAPEKNLGFLTRSLIIFLKNNPNAHFLVAGGGAMESQIREQFANEELSERLHLAGVVQGQSLADIYAAMDVFAFSSFSETQGLVLAEAMTAGTPVVALSAPGAREIVRHGVNGYLLESEVAPVSFADALATFASTSASRQQTLCRAAKETAKLYSREISVQRTIDLYSKVLAANPVSQHADKRLWETATRSLGQEWEILGNFAHAVGDAVLAPETKK